MSRAVLVSDFIEHRWRKQLDLAAPGLRRLVLGPEGTITDQRGKPATADEVDVAFFSGDLYPDRSRDFFIPLLGLAPRAPDSGETPLAGPRWMHTFSAGVDHPVFHRFLAAGWRLTTSSGASASTIAETAMLFLLSLSRGVRAWEEARNRKAWEPHPVSDLLGSRLAVVGLGPIGRAIAERAMAFGMHVTAFTRTARDFEPFPVLPLGELDDALGDVDYLVLALPLTDATHHLFDAARLARLKPGAFFVNIARGELVDENALVEALVSGRLAGAALDVFETEPLPPESPLWTMPNVLVTPHSSGRSASSDDRATGIFLDNLARYSHGHVLRNEVDNRGEATT